MSAKEYLTLAEEYLMVVENNLQAELLNPSASAAVHAAICANDAACLTLSGERPVGKTHGEAVRLLKRAYKGMPFEAEASARARQLTDILGIKTDAEYSGQRVTERQAARVVEQARRFVRWAREVVVASGK